MVVELQQLMAEFGLSEDLFAYGIILDVMFWGWVLGRASDKKKETADA